MISSYDFGNHPKKVAGYKAFWNRDSVARPLVGFSFKKWFPLKEFAIGSQWESETVLTPEMIDPEKLLDDQEKLLREGEQIEDDILRGASAWQAVPWLGGSIGCPLRVLPGSILAVEQNLNWDELKDIYFGVNHPWFQKYVACTQALVRHSAGRYPVSHGVLLGPSDLVAALRGSIHSSLDLLDEPEKISELLHKIGDFFIQTTQEIWKHIPQFYGGYFDAQYQLWTPGPTARMQEDAIMLYSPSLYRKILQPVDRYIAQQFSHGFFHLHATSAPFLDALLEIEEIRCFQFNNDVSGPAFQDMIPHFQKIQQGGRSLLIRGSFSPNELKRLLDAMEPTGLYLYIMVQTAKEIDLLRSIVGM